MRRKITRRERALLEEKLAKYEAMFARFANNGGGYTIEEGSLIVRRLTRIRETLELGWTTAERGRRLYE
jgi:hypothetical protein